MTEDIRRALEFDRVVDITTIGRKTGQPRRIETWFHNVEGAVYITGTPGRRSWLANLLANPDFTFHLKESTTADLPATATEVVDAEERQRVLAEITRRVGAADRLDAWVEGSPLVAIQFAG